MTNIAVPHIGQGGRLISTGCETTGLDTDTAPLPFSGGSAISLNHRRLDAGPAGDETFCVLIAGESSVATIFMGEQF
jgi:hypothetical protein